jgi:hypothetical protein
MRLFRLTKETILIVSLRRHDRFFAGTPAGGVHRIRRFRPAADYKLSGINPQ